MVAPFRQVAFRHCCPRCGEGNLYQSFLKVADNCSHCQLDLTKADAGDGPAVFIITILGFLVVIQMMVLEWLYTPPLWLHIGVMTAFSLAGTYLMLPICKSIMIALQYRTKSGDVEANRLDD